MSRITNTEIKQKESIAIIGMGCMLPGGIGSPEGLWSLLMDKIDAISDVPPDRWDKDSFYDPDEKAAGKMNVKQGGFLDKINCFDAGFFGIAPIQARTIDPQHRFLLECSYMACEDAGLSLEELSGTRTGVFVGISSHDYGDIHHGFNESV